MKLPRMYRVRQKFDRTKVNSISETVETELGKLSLTNVKPGQRIAITAGSRGIANIGQILKSTVDFFNGLDSGHNRVNTFIQH